MNAGSEYLQREAERLGIVTPTPDWRACSDALASARVEIVAQRILPSAAVTTWRWHHLSVVACRWVQGWADANKGR